MARMNMTISIHNTPKEVYDALPLEELAPYRNPDENPTRWKTIEVGDNVEITFFKDTSAPEVEG